MASEVIKLLDFRMFRTDTLVWYSLQLSNGRECWVVTRRYSEFLRCHVKLLELFHREQLPTFPPKEPFWQRVFGGEATRDNWMEERYARLFGYIVGLLDIEGVRYSDALLEFLNAPSHNNGQEPEPSGAETPVPSSAIAVIRSVRVRLTGEPGGLEVVIRADAPAPCAVRLALRPLEELGEEWGDASPSLEASGSWERLLELDLDPSKSPELTHPFELAPGSLWQVAAVGVSKDGSMGNVVCIQIRAPENETLSQVRESLSPSREVRESGLSPSKAPALSPELRAETKDPGEASSTATRSSEGVIGPEGKSQDVESEEDEVEGHEREARGRKPGRRPFAAGSSKVISYQGSVAVEYARRIEEQQRQQAERAPHRWSQGLKVSVPVDRLETKERLLELDLDPSKSPELTHPFELAPGSLWQVAAVGVSKDGSMGNVVCIQIRAPENETLSQVRESLSPSREVRESGLSPSKAPALSPELRAETKDPGEASSTATRSSEGVIGPEGKSQDVESEEDEVEGHEGEARGRKPGRRPFAAGSSKVISYQGSVAVEYARRIEEQQRQQAERAPHRWSQGLKVSVPVDRLETKSASGAALPRHHYGTVEVLDHSIQAQQEQQLREDEWRLAVWIHHVTGDAQSGAAAAGKGSLQEALQTGEVLCDLINAIWPGKIVGISRGQGAQTLFKRVANITHFVQFCSSLQLSHSLFVPADLAEGRNFRQVIRCLCALAQHVPETWDGPRFQPAPEVRHSD